MKLGIPDLKYRWIPGKFPSPYVLVTLHGRGGSMHDWDGLEKELQLPGVNYLYLNGPGSFFQGYTWFDNPQDISRSRYLLERVFFALQDQGYPIGDCMMMGFSQGALMTMEFGARFPFPLRAYIAMSGHCHDVVLLAREGDRKIVERPCWLVTHGTQDQQLSVEITRAQVKILQDAGFAIEYREFDKAHTFDFEQEIPFVREWILEKISVS